MKLSSFITLVTTIAVAGSASIVRNPVTFVKAFNCKKTKAPKAPKAPKSRATTPGEHQILPTGSGSLHVMTILIDPKSYDSIKLPEASTLPSCHF